MTGSLAVAALAAVIVGVSTYCVVQLQRQELDAAKKDLTSYKLTVDGQVAEAKREGIKAGETAGNALIRAASLEKQAQELKAANLELEARIAPRFLTDDQASKLIAALRPFAGQQADLCKYVDVESGRLTEQFEKIFVAAGWHINEYQQLSSPRRTLMGLLVEVDPSDSGAVAAARALAAALRDVNLKTEGPQSPLPPDSEMGATWGHPIYRLRFTVGLKPNAP